MSDDPMNDPEVRRWARRVVEELVPMIQRSALTISLVPKGETDVKFAVELGLSIMLDKPIIAVVQPGTQVPAKLVAVADEIVEAGTPEQTSERIVAAMQRLIQEESTS